jgi:hypothetical protein
MFRRLQTRAAPPPAFTPGLDHAVAVASCRIAADETRRRWCWQQLLLTRRRHGSIAAYRASHARRPGGGGSADAA